MTTPTRSIDGLLILGRDGQVQLALGAGEMPEIATMAADPTWMAQARARRILPLRIGEAAYAVLVAPLAQADLIVLSRPPGDAVLEFLGAVDFAYDILNHLVNDPFDAMTVVDGKGDLVYISPIHEAFFGLAHGEARGRPVREVIENTRLDQVVRAGESEIGEVQRMRGSERVVSRVPIKRDGVVIGAVGRVMFKSREQVEALSRRINALESELAFYKREAAALRGQHYGLEALIGDSRPMQRLREQVVKLAPLDMPVLIHGESGTGKELVAAALHRLSARRDEPLVTVNAAALPATLVESELFGYEPGAFTGADRKGRRGKFEQADGGTILLDEIGDMPIEVQAKLLRVLQDRMVERIGASRPRKVDFRLICATNHDLEALVGQERFRLDLFYRISPIVIEVPPLRDRAEDIPALVDHFLAEIAHRHGRPAPRVGEDVLHMWSQEAWPGNVRQLRHEVERGFVFAANGWITAATLAEYAGGSQPRGALADTGDNASAASLKAAVASTEDEMIAAALERHNGNKKRVAAELGISRSYLYKKLGKRETAR